MSLASQVSALATRIATEVKGKAPLSHTHGVGDLTATGTKNGTKFLRDDNTWQVPPGGGGTEALALIVPPVGGAITAGHANNTTSTPAVGTAVLGLMTLPPATWDAVICRVNSPAAGATVKILAYNVSPNGGLGSLLFEAAAAAATAGGNVLAPLPSALVVAGSCLPFWVGLANQGGAAASFWCTGIGYGLPRVNGVAANIDLGGINPPAGIQITGVTGSAPASPTFTWLSDTSVNVPRIAFRRSA